MLIVADCRGNYDSTGNRTTVTNSAGYASYTVDAFNRVTFDGTYHYDYDPEGNRVAKYIWTDAGTYNGIIDRDANGRVDPTIDTITDWTEYTWDNRNRLTEVTFNDTDGDPVKTVAFAYDWLNRWIATEVDATPGTAGGETSEYFVYGQATLPDEVAPWDRAAVDSRDIGQITLRLDETQKITNRYLWGPAVDQILADEQISWTGQDYGTDRILWPVTDHQGTVRDLAAVNATSGETEIVNTYSYDAYGLLLAETDPTVDHLFGFTARPTQTDAGLINCLNRWYDPVIASWTTEDPISFQGGDANLYRYCGNDPINHVDPNGLIGFGVPNLLIGDGVEITPQGSPTYNPYAPGADFPWYTVPNEISVYNGMGWLPGQAEAVSGTKLSTGLDRVQVALDAGGTVEPTPFCDLANAAISVCRGNFFDAGCSLAGVIPIIGDTAKVAKYGNKVRKGAKAAEALVDGAKKVADDVAEGAGKLAPNKVPTPTVKGAGKVADVVPSHVPKNWKKPDIEDAILDYEHSIKVRQAEAARFDAAGGGHTWARKAHQERIAQEEDFLRQLKRRLEEMR